MDINTLHSHNYEAYQKIMQHFDEGHQKSCVVHATGTGKSYIITAVTDCFERVLIVTTNMFVIDQVRDTIKAELPERTTEPVYKIYPALLQDMDNQVDCLHKYDLIVLDEFHHGGAERWGQAVTWILEQNPEAKVLGTSATAIRHSDNMRDMGEELFEGHVLSRLPLGEAWARKILMAPYYIMAVEDSEEFHNEFIKKIEESKLLEEKKHYYREMASHLKDNYEMEKNASEIIRKWLPADSRRIIVFSKNIEEAESNVSKVEGWMKKAGFNVDNIYMVHSQRPFEEKKAQMAAFQTDNFNGIKIMVAVDMLNEGVHIPRVDAVFFLRKTESPTIFLQQMGRCMGLYKEGGRRPVIFDFRNNVENTNRSTSTRSFFGEAAKDYDNWKDLEEESLDSQTIRDTDKEEKFRGNFPDGINYTLDYGVMLDRFGEDLSNADWDANYAEAKAFFEEHGHFPTYKGNMVMRNWAGNWWRRIYLKNPEVNQEKADMLIAIGFVYQTAEELNDELWMNNYLQCKVFFDEHGHFPTKKENERLNSWGRKWYNDSYLKNSQLYQAKADMLIAIGFEYQTVVEYHDNIFIKKYKIAKEFYFKYGRFPNNKDIKGIRNYFNRLFLNGLEHKSPKKVQLLQEIGYNYKKRKGEDLLMCNACFAEVYYKRYGKKIPVSAEYINIAAYLSEFWGNEEKRIKRPDVVEILQRSGFEDKVKEDLLMKYALQAEEYYIKHGRKISNNGEYKNVYSTLMYFWRREKKRAARPDVVEILQRSGFEDKVKEDLLMKYALQAEEYYIKHGRKISKKEEYSRSYSCLINFWRNEKRRAARPDIVEILQRSGFEY